MAQLMYRISAEVPTDIRSVRADIPPCLTEIVDKALAKDNESRYASGAEMAEALRQCASKLQG
jgi:serine/threonine-protein kinase